MSSHPETIVKRQYPLGALREEDRFRLTIKDYCDLCLEEIKPDQMFTQVDLPSFRLLHKFCYVMLEDLKTHLIADYNWLKECSSILFSRVDFNGFPKILWIDYYRFQRRIRKWAK